MLDAWFDEDADSAYVDIGSHRCKPVIDWLAANPGKVSYLTPGAPNYSPFAAMCAKASRLSK